MPRFLAALACASLLLLGPRTSAQASVPASTTVAEEAHSVTVEIERDGATLEVTRALFNPTLLHAQVELPIPLPCAAILDEVRIEERGPGPDPQWKTAELLDGDEARARFDEYFWAAQTRQQVAGNSDTAVLMTRASHCDATLEIWPIPPLQQRRVAYRVFIPSVYDQGRYTIELPYSWHFGLTPQLEVTELHADGLSAALNGAELKVGAVLDGGRAHTIVLTPDDPGRGRVRAVDLDIAALLASSPAGQTSQLPHLLQAEFEAPAELAQLPPVRRAVVLIDASRSLGDYQRKQLQHFAAAYFEALTATDARVEVLLFDRKVERLYHDFVPAAWGAEDLPKLEIAAGNGSEVGEAIAHARALLSTPSEVEGADWIIVLSDLYLRSDFDTKAEREAAEGSRVRMHVVRPSSGATFAPEGASEPWTAIARAAGGMAWASHDGSSFADELIHPKRIWDLRFEALLADGSHLGGALDDWLAAGQRRVWSEHDLGLAAMTQVAFVGEVWGQRRAWTASPDPIENRRTAAALATHDPTSQLPDAVRSALAFHAGVVSPFSSAWALARFDGAGPEPLLGVGIGGLGGNWSGSSTRCGGVITGSGKALSHPTSFNLLAQDALDRCKGAGDGRLWFETTDLEIVAVGSSNSCVREQIWQTNIEASQSLGRKRVTVSYAAGFVASVAIESL